MTLIRADRLLTRQGKTKSRSQAADLIKRGKVTADGKPVSKPGTLVKNSAQMSVIESPKYVSRGGLKLEPILNHLNLDMHEKIAMDCGASTGGFTDCLLQFGIKKVYAIDVGYGQLHWKLRTDPRVVVLERMNLRYLNPQDINDCIDLITMDLSFISLKLVFPVVSKFIVPNGWVLAMVKPQFEAGRSQVGSGGVVRDRKVIEKVLEDMGNFFRAQGFTIHMVFPAGLTGPKGNQEYFFCMTAGLPPDTISIMTLLEKSKIDALGV